MNTKTQKVLAIKLVKAWGNLYRIHIDLEDTGWYSYPLNFSEYSKDWNEIIHEKRWRGLPVAGHRFSEGQSAHILTVQMERA